MSRLGSLVLVTVVMACRRGDRVVADDARAQPARCALPPENPILREIDLPARCELSIASKLVVGERGRLHVGSGSTFTFGEGAGIVVLGGALEVRGTAEAPVHLRGAGWDGVRVGTFSVSTVSTLALDHVVIAGAAPQEGALVTEGNHDKARVELSHVTFRDNARGLGVMAPQHVTFARDLDFVRNGTAMAASPQVVAAIVGLRFDTPIVLHGSVEQVVELPSTSLPWFVSNLVIVGATGRPASLQFPDGASLKVQPMSRISLGATSFGKPIPGRCALVLRKARVTSAAESPKPHEWNGIHVGEGCEATIVDTSFEWIGAKAIVVERPGPKIVLERNTFTH